MKEKVITIPYEEYQELTTIKKTMESNGDVFIREECCGGFGSHSFWYIYTKDEYIKQILEENHKLADRIKELEKDNEEACFRIGWKSVIEFALVLGFMLLTAYVYKTYL